MRPDAGKFKRKTMTVEAKEADTSDYYMVEGEGVWVNKGEYIVTEPNGTEYVVSPEEFKAQFVPLDEAGPDCSASLAALLGTVDCLIDRIAAIELDLHLLKTEKRKR